MQQERSALIVNGHPDGHSYNAAIRDQIVQSLKEAGYTVRMSDLYQMKFNPVLSKDDFTGSDGNQSLQEEQKMAYQKGGFTEDTKAEMEKLKDCQLLVILAPMWWCSVPAMVKGWIDKVLAKGFAWDENRCQENGLMKGKKAQLVMTVGQSEENFNKNQAKSISIDQMLSPLTYGTLEYCGFDAYKPKVCFGINNSSQEYRQSCLKSLGEYFKNLDSQKMKQ